jgi:uncharacterized protein YecE (DUF72 family)
MPTIRIGTASWTDKTLIDCGRFYPPGAGSAEARLRFYATQFPLVEVDSSYYALPNARNAQLWAERTPAGFTMNVKAFRLFTGHQTAPSALPVDLRNALPAALAAKRNLYYKDLPAAMLDELWQRYLQALEPLRAAGRLGLLHFQFAPWLVCNSAGREHVRECVARAEGHELSVEFRNKSWFAPEHAAATLDFEAELDVTHTVVDEPQGFASSVPQVWQTSNARHALVRLHGRNAATWGAKGEIPSSERFNYDYPDEELRELAAQILQLARQVKETHVVFNNNHEDQGQRNARTLMGLLGEAALGPAH